MNAHWRSNLAQSKKWQEFFEACDGDTLNQAIADILLENYNKAVEIHLYTGRVEITRGKTIAWMQKYNLPFHVLKMRPTGNLRSQC